MPRALKTCSVPGCPNLVDKGRCATCQTAAEQLRGTATQRGYGSRHRRSFRTAVLRRDPLCVCEDQDHDNHGPQCLRPSRVADHWPRSRRELADAGLNPDDPQYGRGICKPCHDRSTAVHQPGGWNAH